ncbi:RNA-directed DNA polymerase [Candidatus Saccharibacteria bacterium]|nr:RNA-directed DNA polymerase [Candidatus Saccharibacteria bacterium]MBR3332297.1 RNA-directed DNA polymerase [Candidatus Saccharibacteria bacterium]
MAKSAPKEIKIEDAINGIKEKGISKWLFDALVFSFTEARRGKLKTHDEHHLEVHWLENLIRLRDQILEKRYFPSASVAFVISDPMIREIFAAPFVDRVVHHFLYLISANWWDKRFINDSYSCRPGKGTLYGIKRVQKMMRQATAGGTKKAYIIKLDISGYFMSLPRAKLYRLVKKGLDQQFARYKSDPAGWQLYRICDFLWRRVLLDDPVKKAHRRGPLKNWDPSILPKRKSLYWQRVGFGIVIGNLTSQLISNIYLDQLDRYIKYVLGYKYYGRYVDDFIIIVPEEKYKQAKRDIYKIESFLKDELGLVLHPKKRYFASVEKGVEFIGARIYPNVIYPSDRAQKHFRKAAMDVAYGYVGIDSLVSHMGIMTHMDAGKFIKEVFDDMGWDYQEPWWGAAGKDR